VSRLAGLAGAPFTYREVGATAGPLPDGYAHVSRRVRLGEGVAAFERVAGGLLSWQVQRGAGLSVVASSPVAEPGAVVVVTLGRGPLCAVAPCRVVYVVNETRRRGFAYGTLPGHPEAGEEAFVVTHEPDGTVTFAIDAFSRPSSRLARLGRPVASWVQRIVTDRYVAAAHTIVRGS
jgi:uncharacterized protein (UPF0548 family)